MAGSGNAVFGPMLSSLGVPLDPAGRALAICLTLDLILLGAMTRSAVVFGAALLVAPVCLLIWHRATTERQIPPASLAWHAVAIGALAWWAIRARRALPGPHQCQGCGYDLRGLDAAACPECGALRSAA